MDEIKRLSADQKALVRKYGVRETHRLIADRLTWARFQRAGLVPLYTRKPRPLLGA